MLSSFFSSIRWQDVVDILLNSYLLFRLYVLFRGTNVFRVITGIAILWFFQRMAFALGLIVTSWVMQGIAAVAALIIIIVFRNEIRSVLHAKNLRAILWSFPHKMANTPIEILADSIFELARRGFGALIVLPGKEDLREYVRGGIPWHGLISKEMIISIFWHDNPVHDGAAIIHTDALIVVVSEERGDVAVAQDSVIKDIRDKNNLIKLLQAHIGISAEITKYPKKEKIEIGAAALASFLFITGVWFSFSQGLDTMTTLEIPIEYMKRDPGMEILDTSVDAVSLQLGGSGALIKSIRPEQVQIRLDLSKAVVGKNTFTITHKNITLPPGIFLKKVQPPVVETTLDTHIKKRLHVQVDWVGRLPDHRTLLDVKIDPEKVLVIGGKRILEKISTIYTEKVPLDNITESGVITVNMILNPVSLKIDSSSKDKITVKYTVK